MSLETASPVISKLVGVERCSASTQERANDCALLTTNCAAEYGTRASSNTCGELIAMSIPKRSVSIPAITSTAVISIAIDVGTLFVTSRIIKSPVARLRSNRNCCECQSQQTENAY